ncbi:MAG TPA: hypothetical protein VMM80_07740 [Bacteroidota bacterium]|nr:hypothetical protein [Bacteroidota bacterium]
MNETLPDMLPGDIRPPGRLTLSLALISVVVVLYLPLARYPFIQDDWALIHTFMFSGAGETLRSALSPAGALFYRPAGILYCAANYLLFGLHPAGFHLLAAGLLALSAFLVVAIAGRLTGDALTSWGSGFVYAAAATIHFESQMWMVGIFDIGSNLCALLCLLAFMKNRNAASAAWFALALGFKEAPTVFPLVLVAAALLVPRHGVERPIAVLAGRLRVHGAVLAAFIACKAAGVSLFSLPLGHPYAARLAGAHTLDHIQLYTRWGMQAILPLKNIHFTETSFLVFFIGGIAALPALIYAALRRSSPDTYEWSSRGRTLAFLATWYCLAILPPVSLHTQVFRYYLGAALAPMAIAAMMFLRGLSDSLPATARRFGVVCLLFAGMNIVDGALFVQERISQGTGDGEPAPTREGYNHLMRKASLVRAVWKPLLDVLPAVPPHAVIVIPGFDTGCFEDRFGPEVWYGDSTLRVTGAAPLGSTSPDTLRIELPPENHWKVPPDTTVVGVPANRVFTVWYLDRTMEIPAAPATPR